MGAEISWEIRQNAEELYIINGLTYDLVAEHTGVSVSQLKRWGGEGRWVVRRKEYRTAQGTIRIKLMEAKANFITSVAESEDPQKAYAFTSLVTAGLNIEKAAAESPVIQANSTRIIKTPQDAVEALQEAVQKKINTMLSDPGGLSLATIKDTKEAMEFVEQLAGKYLTDDKTDKQTQGMDIDQANFWREKVLKGVS